MTSLVSLFCPAGCQGDPEACQHIQHGCKRKLHETSGAVCEGASRGAEGEGALGWVWSRNGVGMEWDGLSWIFEEWCKRRTNAWKW